MENRSVFPIYSIYSKSCLFGSCLVNDLMKRVGNLTNIAVHNFNWTSEQEMAAFVSEKENEYYGGI